jgi:hypothetical protein
VLTYMQAIEVQAVSKLKRAHLLGPRCTRKALDNVGHLNKGLRWPQGGNGAGAYDSSVARVSLQKLWAPVNPQKLHLHCNTPPKGILGVTEDHLHSALECPGQSIRSCP